MTNMTAERFTCRFCGSHRSGRRWQARDMYFGLDGSFEYDECADCSSLNIVDIPEDLPRYYAQPGYGGHARTITTRDASPLRRLVRKVRTDLRLGRFGALGRQLHGGADGGSYPWKWLTTAGVTRASAILDVGCGGGDLLKGLRNLGFTNLAGLDKFISGETHETGLTIRRGEITELRGTYDLIMMHHSLEHVPDPASTLRHLASLLAPGGTLLIRVPLGDCAAWREYGVDWYQLDAPRHLYLPSVKGMTALAASANLEVAATDFDSTAAQFFVSAGYRKGILMTTQRERGFDHVSAGEMTEYERRTRDANLDGTGDQAGFFLRRKSSAGARVS